MKPSFVSRYLFFNIRKDIYFLILIFKIKFYSILYTLSFDPHSISGSCNLGYRIFFYLFFFRNGKNCGGDGPCKYKSSLSIYE